MPSANCGIYFCVYPLSLLCYFNFKILIETFDIMMFVLLQIPFK